MSTWNRLVEVVSYIPMSCKPLCDRPRRKRYWVDEFYLRRQRALTLRWSQTWKKGRASYIVRPFLSCHQQLSMWFISEHTYLRSPKGQSPEVYRKAWMLNRPEWPRELRWLGLKFNITDGIERVTKLNFAYQWEGAWRADRGILHLLIEVEAFRLSRQVRGRGRKVRGGGRCSVHHLEPAYLYCWGPWQRRRNATQNIIITLGRRKVAVVSVARRLSDLLRALVKRTDLDNRVNGKRICAFIFN